MRGQFWASAARRLGSPLAVLALVAAGIGIPQTPAAATIHRTVHKCTGVKVERCGWVHFDDSGWGLVRAYGSVENKDRPLDRNVYLNVDLQRNTGAGWETVAGTDQWIYGPYRPGKILGTWLVGAVRPAYYKVRVFWTVTPPSDWHGVSEFHFVLGQNGWIG